MKTLVFGSCNIDLFFGVPHIVSPGETVACSSLSQRLGGKGFNQAVALARAGADTYFAGSVGSDGFVFRDYLEKEGVDCSFLAESPLPTGKAFIQVSEKGENSIIIHHGANFGVKEENISAVFSSFGPGDTVVLQNEVNGLEKIIDCAFSKGMNIVLNPSPFEENLRNIDLEKITLLFVNETECAQMSGGLSPEAFIALTRKEHPSLAAVITLGASGSIYFDKTSVIRQSAVLADVVDTTGAGDTFTGYFLREYYSSGSAEKALLIASKASALTVSRPGAAEAIPRLSELL